MKDQRTADLGDYAGRTVGATPDEALAAGPDRRQLSGRKLRVLPGGNVHAGQGRRDVFSDKIKKFLACFVSLFCLYLKLYPPTGDKNLAEAVKNAKSLQRKKRNRGPVPQEKCKIHILFRRLRIREATGIARRR